MSRKERVLIITFLLANLGLAYWLFDGDEWRRLTGSLPVAELIQAAPPVVPLP